MGPLEGLAYGFSVALLPSNLFACFIGVLVGTIVGVLPGIGPVGAMALLLPSTFALQPATALIMLAGIYYGAMYGGSTTSILVNVPGEAGSVVTLLDGYQMTRKGRAGAALTIAAVGLVRRRHRRRRRHHAGGGLARRRRHPVRAAGILRDHASAGSCCSRACRAARCSRPS